MRAVGAKTRIAATACGKKVRGVCLPSLVWSQAGTQRLLEGASLKELGHLGVYEPVIRNVLEVPAGAVCAPIGAGVAVRKAGSIVGLKKGSVFLPRDRD